VYNESLERPPTDCAVEASNGRQGFRVKPGHVLRLLFLIVAPLTVIYWPTLEWAVAALEPSRSMSNDRLEVVIPAHWMGRLYNSSLEEWTPCLTIFCSAPRSSMKLQIFQNVASREPVEVWEPRVKSELEAQGFLDPSNRTLYNPDGAVNCLQMNKHDKTLTRIVMTCYGRNSGLVAAFEGAPGDLEDFRFVIIAAKVVGNRE
jgi:hypothetical protein